MNTAKRKTALVVVAVFVTMLAAASSWEGSAMIGTYGDFPASGYYAACNSFARNTAVEVVNLENGRSITVIVTRTIETPGIFMMLSVEAASALGVQQGRVARIRASEPRSAVELSPTARSGSSFDPDLNPRLMAAQELKRLGYELSPAGPAVSSPIAPKAPAQVMGVPAPAPASTAPVVSPAEPRIPAAVAAVTVAPTATAPKVAEKPSSVTIEAPSGAIPPVGKVPVAEPVPLSSEKPVSVASAKLKPVRTIVLPQLPEPSAPVPKAPPAVVVATPVVPEAIAMAMPVPDETPLRVSPSDTPKRYEAPSLRPEISTAILIAPDVKPPVISLGEPTPVDAAHASAFARNTTTPYSESVIAALSDPAAPGHEGATALVLASPGYASISTGIALVDPEARDGERALAFQRMAPGMTVSQAVPALDWPELEADEIPEIGLALLAAPGSEIPATSLAEGEIILPVNEGPSALALETPEYGAAETSVALADAEPEAEEVPGIDSPAGLSPLGGFTPAELAEAEEKAGEVPDVVAPAILNPETDATAVALAEAEEKAAEQPLAESKAGLSPYKGDAATPLTEATEQKPETTDLIGAPAERVAVVDPLDTPKEYIVAIEPTGPKPPVAVPATTAPVVTPPVATVTVKPSTPATVTAKAPVAAIDILEKGRFYIQIGAYGSEATAKDAALSVGKNFGAVVQKVSAKGKDTWRVYVGPLSRDESGVALVRVRALGFKDAFVKSGG
jgi:hypothetical protein